MKVAVIQLNAQQDKDQNISYALEMVRRSIAVKAKFILLPEVFNYRGSLEKMLDVVAEPIPGKSLKPLMELAQRHKVNILAGSVYEQSPRRNRVYNTSVFIDARGKITAKYRKIHLFEAAFDNKIIREKKYFLAGTKRVTVKINDFRVGLTTCYDLRFPELYRQYFSAGCNVLVAPSAFTKKTGQAHWEILVRARAIENLCYILAPNQIGQDSRGVETYGHSLIVGPWGEIVAEGSADKEEILLAEVRSEDVRLARKILPQIAPTR